MKKYYALETVCLIGITLSSCSMDKVKSTNTSNSELSASKSSCTNAIYQLIKNSSYRDRIYDGVLLSYEYQNNDVIVINLRSPEEIAKRSENDSWLITWLQLNLNLVTLIDTTIDDLNPVVVTIDRTYNSRNIDYCKL